MVVAEVLRLVRHHCSTAREGTLVDLGATLHLALVRPEDGLFTVSREGICLACIVQRCLLRLVPKTRISGTSSACGVN